MASRCSARPAASADAHPRVERDHAVGVGEQGVDVELLDLGNVDHHLDDLEQRQRDGVEIGGAACR